MGVSVIIEKVKTEGRKKRERVQDNRMISEVFCFKVKECVYEKPLCILVRLIWEHRLLFRLRLCIDVQKFSSGLIKIDSERRIVS